MRPTHTRHKDEKYFEKGFDFMLFFTAILSCDDKRCQNLAG